MSFTTTDPAVQSVRMLLIREPGDGLFQLDIFEHGRKVLERVEQRRQPTAEEVQQYLNRLRDFDFSAFSIERKHEVANTVNRLFEASGLDVLISDPKQDGRLTRITRMKCYVPNERSKGSFQARIGSTTVYTGRTWPELIVQKPD